MELKIFTVHDSKVGAYLQPFFMRSRGEAIRAFITVVNDRQSQFYSHPEDYTLFEVGTYDDQTGRVEAHHVLEPLGLAKQYHHGYDNAASNIKNPEGDKCVL